MYKILILFFCLASLLLFFTLTHVSDNDRCFYAALVHASSGQKDGIGLSSQQVREHVVREIWSKEPQCLQIASERSFLELLYHNHRFEAHEELTHARYSDQNVSLEAETARMVIKENKPNIAAEGVTGAIGNLNGSQTSVAAQKALYDGEILTLSENVSLSLANQTKMECSSLTYDHVRKTAHFMGFPYVKMTDERGTAYAQHATIDFEPSTGTLNPFKIVFKDNVRLHRNEDNKHQFVLADQITYFPQKEQIILVGKENRVLFFDESQGMQLSATEIHATRNPETKEEKIDGIGDVRFLFSSKEFDKLKEKFKWP